MVGLDPYKQLEHRCVDYQGSKSKWRKAMRINYSIEMVFKGIQVQCYEFSPLALSGLHCAQNTVTVCRT